MDRVFKFNLHADGEIFVEDAWVNGERKSKIAFNYGDRYIIRTEAEERERNEKIRSLVERIEGGARKLADGYDYFASMDYQTAKMELNTLLGGE